VKPSELTYGPEFAGTAVGGSVHNNSPKMRLDRIVSIGLSKLVPGVLGWRSQQRIPILMYHGIQTGLGMRHPYFETNTSPNLFEAQMRFLSEAGYKAASLNEILEAIRTKQKMDKWVAITFDDGYKDFYTQAFPILQKYNLHATVFVVPGFINGLHPEKNRCDYMSWEQIREVSAHGISIGSHTMTHPALYTLPLSVIEEQVRQSKDLIQNELGSAIDSFAYPFAFPEYDQQFVGELREVLQTHSYRCGVCTIIGRAHSGHDHFFLPRLPVNSYDDLRFFDAKLNGGYDWLHTLQYPVKVLKARLS
jgi:peptidoglycan/xylan/chitin deacetylase (PgdA/CDA1 family)